uniref:Uncharacterized protein n=1 Tax=Glossina austeni TaxID=7395 RepID=A0A1A9UXC5_GLOAU
MEDINAETTTSEEVLRREKKLIFQVMKVIHDRYKQLDKSCQEPSHSLKELQRIYLDYMRDRLNNLESKNSFTLSQPVEELKQKLSENAEVTVTLHKTNNCLQSRDNKLEEKIGELYAELKENDLVQIEIEFLSQARETLEEDAKKFHGPAQKQNTKLAELRRGKEKLAQALEERHVKAEFNQNTNLLNRKIKILSEAEREFESVEQKKSVVDLLDLLDETHEHVTKIQQICEMLCNDCTFRTQPLKEGEEFELKYLQEENRHLLGTIIALSRNNATLPSKNSMSEGEAIERIEEIRNNNLLLKTQIHSVSKEKETLEKELKLLEDEELERTVLEEQLNQLKIKYFDHEDTIEEDKQALQQEKQIAEEELGQLKNEKCEVKKQFDELHETYNSLHVEFENLKAHKSEQDEEMNELKHQIQTLNNENEDTLKQFEDLKQPSICEEESPVQCEKLVTEENFCSLIQEEHQQMEELQQTIEKLNEENISKTEQIEKLKRREQEQQENIKLLNEVKDLREQIEILQAQKSQLEEKRNELNEKVTLNNSLKGETQSLEEERDVLEENQNKSEYARDAQMPLHEKLEKLQEESQAMEDELNKNIAKFNNLMHKLIGEFVSFRAACEELENLEAKQYEELNSLRNQIQLLENEKEKLEEELRQLIEAKEQSRSELEEKVNELKIKYFSEKGTLEQERNILVQELLRVEEELQKVINERNKLKERLGKLQEERAKLKASKEKREELKREEQKKQNLLKIQIEIIEDSKRCHENALRTIKNVAQKSTVGEMQEQLRTKEVDQLKDIKKTEERLGSLQQQELSMQEELIKVTKAKRELRDKLNDLNIEINSMAANYEDIEELGYKCQEGTTLLKHQISALGEKINNLKNNLTQLEDLRKSLDEKV